MSHVSLLQHNPVSPDTLKSLLNAARLTARSDRRAGLAEVAKQIHKSLHIESSGIFLFPPDSYAEISLEANYCDKYQSEVENLSFPLGEHAPRSGKSLTRFVALKFREGETDPIVLNGQDLWAHPQNGRNESAHLREPSTSFLAVPILTPKPADRCIGMLKIQNKKVVSGDDEGGGDYRVDGLGFGQEDVELAKIFADAISLIVHSASRLRKPEQVIHAFSEVQEAIGGGTRELVYPRLLTAVNLVLGAQGSFIAWQNEGTEDYAIQDTCPSVPVTVGLALFPEPAKEAVANDRTATTTSDSSPDKPKGRLWPGTRVAYASPIRVGRRRGVLQVEFESAELAGQIQGRMVESMCRYIERVALVLQRQAELIETESFFSAVSAENVSMDLKNLLQILVAQYKLTAGLIWVADDVHAGLRYGAHIGCDFAFGEQYETFQKPEDLFFPFREKTFATYVWQRRLPTFTEDLPSHEPVKLEMAERLRVREGVGIPLMAGDGPVGVLIAWTPIGSEGSPATPEHVKSLEPLANLAASAIRSRVVRRRAKAATSAIRSIIDSLLTPFKFEAIRSQILEAVRSAGFDRVRLFDYSADHEQFSPVDSRGMEDGKPIEPIRVGNSLADIDLLATLEAGARRYFHDQFGHDTSGGKERDTDWAVAPIIVGSQLRGKLAADAQYTKRKISDESLEYLNIFSALLGYALYRSEWNEMEAMSRISEAIRNLGQRANGLVEIAASKSEAAPRAALEAWLHKERLRFSCLADQIDLWHRLRTELNPAAETSTSLRKTVESVLEEAAVDVAEKRIQIEKALGENPCEIPIPEVDQKAVVRALVNNAIEHAARGGVVAVELQVQSGFCNLAIRNDGDIIQPEFRARIFKPFFTLQSDGFRTDGPEAALVSAGEAAPGGFGLGLGLAIAHELVQRYHGTIVCGDGKDGLGASFVCRLPTR